ncbi:hypothetical protein [Aquipseudomonas ullengensis]|uniref:Uncharacterized protein n=1 Tax=Aquipseudomonas ullengensis TaxID=2759166 RepID=A0A7W4QCJ6_9GAMM|nr:hypothetical protein [Pseudomonas ullengensis]MBB2493503.1 hypothetical protein [Pseudomonas ullengensis]
MDKLINSMEYIDIGMACQWLCHLTESPFPLPSRALMELCERYATPIYIDCSALEGVIAPRVGSRFVMQQVIGIGHCQVDSPISAYEAFEPHRSGGINVSGLAVALSDREESELSHVDSWTLTSQEGRPFLFRPDDIKRLASLLKPDQDENATQSQVQSEDTATLVSSRTEQRLTRIRQWFGEQREYNAAQLSKPIAGLPGARDACWQWLTHSGLTAQGTLFCGSSQQNSGKSKKFISAWNAFLKEVITD